MTTRSSGVSGGRAAGAQRGDRRPGGRRPVARPLERRGEPLVRERLQQVVDRVDLERPQGELVVRRDEDDRHAAAEQLEHLEAVELRHLDVEEQQVRLQLA